jgi:hypothetical protein
MTISGIGFGATNTISVRFSDSTGYQVDVQAIESDSTSAVVCVPPYCSAGKYGTGTVSVQVLQTSGSDSTKSNSISDFQIQDLPISTTPTGTVTLNLLTAELNYYDSLENQIKGTAMETQTMDSAISVNIVNLTNLVSKIQSVVLTSVPFSLGSINGVVLSVGSKELQQSDRLILAMFRSNPALAKRLATTGCPDYLSNDAIAGINSSNAFRSSADCIVQSIPSAFSTSFGFVLGIGGATMGTMGLGLELLGVAVPPAGFALAGCAILYAGVMYAGSELAIGAELKNLNNTASYQAVQIGIKQTEALFTDPIKSAVVGKLFGQTVGYLKDIYDGYEQASSAIETSPIGSNCTYKISSPGQPFDSSGGTGTVTITTGSGCTWTAEVDNVDWITVTSNSNNSGSGTVNFSVQANTTHAQRTGAIFIAGKSFDITQTGSDSGTNVGITYVMSNYTGSTTITSSSCKFGVNIAGTFTITITGGEGSMISPYTGTMTLTAIWQSPVLQGINCASSSEPISIPGTVSGSSLKVEGGGTVIDSASGGTQETITFSNGTLSGNSLTGTLTINGSGFDSPITSTITLNKN